MTMNEGPLAGVDMRSPAEREDCARVDAMEAEWLPILVVMDDEDTDGTTRRLRFGGKWPEVTSFAPLAMRGGFGMKLTGEVRIEFEDAYATYVIEGVDRDGGIVVRLDPDRVFP